MSRGWTKDSACRLQITLSCAVLCHIMSLQYLSRSSLHRMAGLPCGIFLSYGLQMVAREVHRLSLRRLICPAQDHFIFLTVYITYTRCKYFDPCYARATVVRARFLAAAFSDGSYLAHVNGAYLRHVTFCIVRGPPLSPICERGSGRCSLNVPRNTCVPYFSRNEMSRLPWTHASPILAVM